MIDPQVMASGGDVSLPPVGVAINIYIYIKRESYIQMGLDINM